jgi:subtilisin-like proprotein convertase family protein
MSTGQVLFNRPINYPVMNASGLIFLPFTEEEPVYFAKSYAPGSLSLMDDSSTPASSQVVVTREGTVSAVTLQLSLRGDWLAGRFNVTLIAPDGTEVYDASGLGTNDDNEPSAESFDGGIVLRPNGQVGTEGTWTLLVRDVGGNDDGLKSGDLYAWSLNFHDVDTWDSQDQEQGPPGGEDPEEPGDFPAGWSCNGADGYENFQGQFYGDGDCDCGCGAMDIDCASNNISACEYEFCPQAGDVNPSNIATCL